MKQAFLCCMIAFAALTPADLFAQATLKRTAGQPKPFVLGVIDELQSEILGERRILNVYLPEGYDQADTARYPVIYLLDGSADEDFIHVAGLVQFNSFPWINRVPKSIVVGIANIDRKRDFTFPTASSEYKKIIPSSGRSAAFIRFISDELQPYMQRSYRTAKGKTIIGESLGGLLATEILLKKPDLFDQYIIISPSLWWDNGSLLDNADRLLSATTGRTAKVYIAVGKEGLTPGRQPRVMEVDANILADKLKTKNSTKLHVHFDYLPEEDHATIGHQALLNAFIWLSRLTVND